MREDPVNAPDDIVRLLQQIAKDRFWGSVQIDFRDGAAVLIRKTETIKINGREENRRHESRQ